MVGFELMLTVIQDFPAHRWILSWWQREPGLNTEQARRSNPSLSRLLCCPRQNVCSIHSLIGEGREKLCKMFTSAIFAMNARQTGTSMLLGEQWRPNKLSSVMFITRELARAVMFGQLQQQQITGRHDAPDWTSRNDDGALGKINNCQQTSPGALLLYRQRKYWSICINIIFNIQHSTVQISQQSFIYEWKQNTR